MAVSYSKSHIFNHHKCGFWKIQWLGWYRPFHIIKRGSTNLQVWKESKTDPKAMFWTTYTHNFHKNDEFSISTNSTLLNLIFSEMETHFITPVLVPEWKHLVQSYTQFSFLFYIRPNLLEKRHSPRYNWFLKLGKRYLLLE